MRYLRIAAGYVAAVYSINVATVVALRALSGPSRETIAQLVTISVAIMLLSGPAFLVPALACISVAERRSIRHIAYYIVAGIVVGVIGANLYMFVSLGFSDDRLGFWWPRFAWGEIASTTAYGVPLGALWGLVYWSIAGRRAGWP